MRIYWVNLIVYSIMITPSTLVNDFDIYPVGLDSYCERVSICEASLNYIYANIHRALYSLAMLVCASVGGG